MPWRGKKDVERHNKKCSQYEACRKIWLRAANDYYAHTGDDGQAVIRANVAAKYWLQSHGKYRRNIDEDLRHLEREAISGDELARERFIHAQIRAGIIPPEFPSHGLWVNAYVNNQAKASLHASSWEEVDAISQFLQRYFTTPPMKSEERETYDLDLRQTITIPEDPLQVIAEESPAFDFIEGRPWPRPCHYEPYVSFFMKESLDPDDIVVDPDDMDPDGIDENTNNRTDDVILRWINVYSVIRVCGSSAEGGDWYNHRDPMGCLFIDDLSLTDASNRNYPPHIQTAFDFLHEVYDDRAYGDIYSVRGGVEIDITTEEGPAQRTPPYHHYE